MLGQLKVKRTQRSDEVEAKMVYENIVERIEVIASEGINYTTFLVYWAEEPVANQVIKRLRDDGFDVSLYEISDLWKTYNIYWNN